MRGRFVCGVTILITIPTIVWSASDGIPTLDVRPVCRGIASQSADPGVGQRDQTNTFQQCVESERAVLDQLKRQWSDFSAADKRHCVTLATTGGESSNTELLTCLEMSRDVRVQRSAASAAQTTKPASTPSTPITQPVAAPPIPDKDLAKPIPDKDVPKKEGNEAKEELQRARAEADSAKASEASVQRRLADAEAALKKAKDEAQRASADLERAKAEAQSARESEAAIKTKLADAVAARAKAEQACHSDDRQRPNLGTRLRKWLGRPGSPNQ